MHAIGRQSRIRLTLTNLYFWNEVRKFGEGLFIPFESATLMPDPAENA
jgi:hypothetical protein